MARIPADVLDDLRWQAEHRAAIVTMSKPVLRALLESHARQMEAEERQMEAEDAKNL